METRLPLSGRPDDQPGPVHEGREEKTSSSTFEDLVRPLLAPIHRWALVICGDADEADDVVQDVLLRLHRHRDRLPPSEKRKTWLYRITRNSCLDRLKGRRREGVRRERASRKGETLVGWSGPGPERGLLQKESARLVREFMEHTSRRQREIMDLVDLQGYEPTEAARLLGLKPATARVHLMRARRSLRTWILDHYPEWSPEDDHEV